MCFFTLVFLLGDLYLQSLSVLPSLTFVYSSFLISICLWIILQKHWRYTYLLFAFAAGFFWSANDAILAMAWTLPKNSEGKTQSISGYIASLPEQDHGQQRFLFATHNILLRLTWRDSKKRIVVGDHWQFQARLKRIHSTQNPGAFDYEAWALQKKIRAKGYIIPSIDNKLLSHAWYRYPIDHLRQLFQKQIRAHLPHSQTSPWLLALMIGERNGISEENWQILRNTGTNHLMAVGGLHIGMLAAITQQVFSYLWRYVPRGLMYVPAHLAGACAALATAFVYSALAGFSIPTQRACIMLILCTLGWFTRRKISSWKIWAGSLLCVLIINPLCVLTESVWLSYVTIALIIYGMEGRVAQNGWWWKWGRVQWVIGIGLIPITLIFFQECSLISLVANCIAIPWLGLLVLPFCLLSEIFLWISPMITGLLLLIGDKALAGLWIILTWFSQLHFAIWQHSISEYHLFVILSGCLFLLSPIGFPGRWLSIIWLMPLFFFQHPVPERGEYWLTLLDVDQGLSIVVQTKDHLMVFDVGAKYLNVDMGENIVLPFLRHIGVKKIDTLIVSHGDNDHMGGAAALLKALPVSLIKTSVPNKFSSYKAQSCLAGESWEWDQVHFMFLYPTISNNYLGNNSSCVLSIDNGHRRVLLTGDIEKYAERNLLTRLPGQLAADILVAPHHGSKTSGLKAFLEAVHPYFVLYPIGYRNRYHFPHASVINSYQKMHTHQLDTATSGAITFKIKPNMKFMLPERYRLTHRHYWFD